MPLSRPTRSGPDFAMTCGRERPSDPPSGGGVSMPSTDGPAGSWRLLRAAVGRLLTGAAGREAMRLALRLVGARSMSVVTLVIAAFLADIQAFAAFGVYQTLASLAWIALFLRY